MFQENAVKTGLRDFLPSALFVSEAVTPYPEFWEVLENPSFTEGQGKYMIDLRWSQTSPVILLANLLKKLIFTEPCKSIACVCIDFSLTDSFNCLCP